MKQMVTEPTDWIRNIVIVRTAEKQTICIDPRSLNQARRISHYIMPTLEDVSYKLPKAWVFTNVDTCNTFLQCKPDKDSIRMITFWTTWCRKWWRTLPFGVSLAPEAYKHKQHEVLAGFHGVEPIANAIVIVDEVTQMTDLDHDAKLLVLMDRCRQVKLRLGLKKLQLKVTKVCLHGHVLSSNG